MRLKCCWSNDDPFVSFFFLFVRTRVSSYWSYERFLLREQAIQLWRELVKGSLCIERPGRLMRHWPSGQCWPTPGESPPLAWSGLVESRCLRRLQECSLWSLGTNFCQSKTKELSVWSTFTNYTVHVRQSRGSMPELCFAHMLCLCINAFLILTDSGEPRSGTSLMLRKQRWKPIQQFSQEVATHPPTPEQSTTTTTTKWQLTTSCVYLRLTWHKISNNNNFKNLIIS